MKANPELIVGSLTLIATVVGLIFVFVQIKDGEQGTHDILVSQNTNTVLQILFSVNQQLSSPINSEIFSDIDNGLPIRQKNGGRISDPDLENYLSIYEALGVLYEENKAQLIQNPFLCDTFFDPAQETLDNKEIQGFLSEKRKEFPPYQGYLTTLKEAVDTYEMCPEFN